MSFASADDLVADALGWWPPFVQQSVLRRAPANAPTWCQAFDEMTGSVELSHRSNDHLQDRRLTGSAFVMLGNVASWSRTDVGGAGLDKVVAVSLAVRERAE